MTHTLRLALALAALAALAPAGAAAQVRPDTLPARPDSIVFAGEEEGDEEIVSEAEEAEGDTADARGARASRWGEPFSVSSSGRPAPRPRPREAVWVHPDSIRAASETAEDEGAAAPDEEDEDDSARVVRLGEDEVATDTVTLILDDEEEPAPRRATRAAAARDSSAARESSSRRRNADASRDDEEAPAPRRATRTADRETDRDVPADRPATRRSTGVRDTIVITRRPARTADRDEDEAPPRRTTRPADRDAADRDDEERPASRTTTSRTSTTTTTSTRTTASSGRPRSHTVQPGETFYGIARKYGVTSAQLRALNPDVQWQNVRAGDVLRLPANARAQGQPAARPSPSADSDRPSTQRPSSSARRRTHTVERGETLYGIARRYGVSVEALQRANDMDGDQVRAGQTLVLPAAPR
jgi:LysM repeat protein